ncbi:MAG: hypothetical protein GC204_18440 [Chloroflexi bacterium]|nr:hypothetical protein [Chloroflexota bacterium]
MRRFTFFVVLIFVLLAGGGLTSLLISSGGNVLPFLNQVNAPDADPTTMLAWKANQFFLFIAFVLFNLIGIAATIGILIWLIDWQLKRSKADANAAATEVTAQDS